jgi:hypothetical protein
MGQMTKRLLTGEMRTNPVVSPENLRPVLQRLMSIVVPLLPPLSCCPDPRGKVTAL